jgi:hypothetical protein
LDDKTWTQFYGIAEACLRRLARAGWIKKWEDFKDLYHEYISTAFIAGTPFRMAERPADHRAGYIFSCVKGWLYNRNAKLIEERKRFTSLDALVEDCGDSIFIQGT